MSVERSPSTPHSSTSRESVVTTSRKPRVTVESSTTMSYAVTSRQIANQATTQKPMTSSGNITSHKQVLATSREFAQESIATTSRKPRVVTSQKPHVMTLRESRVMTSAEVSPTTKPLYSATSRRILFSRPAKHQTTRELMTSSGNTTTRGTITSAERVLVVGASSAGAIAVGVAVALGLITIAMLLFLPW